MKATPEYPLNVCSDTTQGAIRCTTQRVIHFVIWAMLAFSVAAHAESRATDKEPLVAGAVAGEAAKTASLKPLFGNLNTNVDLCEGLTVHQKSVPIKRFAKPPFMKYYNEPAFNTRVIRITNSGNAEVHKPAYSSMQAWNADESLLLLYHTGLEKNGYVLLDGHNYKFVKSLEITPTDVEEVFWSHNNPDYLFYVSKTHENYAWFVRYNVRTDKLTRLHKFDKVCPGGLPTSGNAVQMQSLDDDLFGFRCQLESGHVMFSYRISTNTTAYSMTGDGTPWDPWSAPMPAPSGKRLELQGSVLSPGLDRIEHKLDQAVFHEHSSLGRTTSGQDALFQTIFDPSPNGCDGAKERGVAHLTEYNLETGKCRAIISQAEGWPYTTSGTHVSALASHRPGWVAMSSIGYNNLKFLENEKPAPALMSEIYLVNTDPKNTRLCRLAQHRSYAKAASNARYAAYFGEPHATISPSGTRIVFGSDWYDSGSVDSYVIELPAYKSAKN